MVEVMLVTMVYALCILERLLHSKIGVGKPDNSEAKDYVLKVF